jgi:fatty-acid desaturase
LQLGLSFLVWGVALRTVATWHTTWGVNSLVHRHGYKNYDTPDDSRNSWVASIFASGEGWHNNHHHDQASASNRHKWWELDLSFGVVWCLERLGLATNVIRPRHERKAARTRAPAS